MRTSLVCTSCFAACAVAVVSTFGVAQQVAPDDNDPALTKLLEQRRDMLAERVTQVRNMELPEDQAKSQFLIGNINHDTILLAKAARLQEEIELKREENKRP